MARAAKHGPVHRTGVYPKGDRVQTWDGKDVGKIVHKTCRRVRPGERGAWISNEACSYIVEIDGRRYVGRGRGDGIALTLRQRKSLDGLAGSRRRRRRKR